MGPNSQESDLIGDRKGRRDTGKAYMEEGERQTCGAQIVAGSPKRATRSEEGFFQQPLEGVWMDDALISDFWSPE